MARTSIAILERELEYARKRQAYLSRTDRPVKATVDKRPKILVGYKSSLAIIGAASISYKVPVVESSLAFIAGAADNFAALGLIAPTDTPNFSLAQIKPKALKPAMIKVVVGDPTPTVKTAAGSGRRYVKYSANSAGDAQSSYSAPVSKVDTLITPVEQRTAAVARITAIKGKLGGSYGRAYFVPESFTQSVL